MHILLIIIVFATQLVGCDDTHDIQGSDSLLFDASTNRVLPVSEVKWQPLNPARGDKSPLAGTLWGDRHGEVATGFLAKFVDGFSSPPHIHNATYRAVVISGLIHNDDPGAAPMWMPNGSFWTQPKGEVHITAAKGEVNIALVEIDKGPYLVHPPESAFDEGERPVNVDASNIVWVDFPDALPSPDGPKVAYLWGEIGEGKTYATFLKIPSNFAGKIISSGTTFHGVVIKGSLDYLYENPLTLQPGSYFGSKEKSVHQIASSNPESVVVYVRTNGKYELSMDR